MKSPPPTQKYFAARAFCQRYAILFVLAGVAIACSFVVRHDVFSAFSWNRDEPIYLWQARMFQAGHVAGTDGGNLQFFQPWLTGARNGTVFSQYTPGWPMLLAAAGALFGSPGFALAFSAVLVVLGTYALTRVLLGEHPVALVAAAVMTLSPILVIQSGLYLGYLFSLGLGLWLGVALLVGFRRGQGSRSLFVVGGGLLGLIFLTRPFDALLWAVAFAAYLGVTKRHEPRSLWRAACWVALGLTPLVAVGLAYNAHLTGSLTKFPITVADPLDKFGFGVRRLMPLWTPVRYTVVRAFRGSARNLFFLPEYLFGSYLGIAVAVRMLWVHRRSRTSIALLALCATFPIGYLVFWGTYLSAAKVTLTGPLYYVPLYPPLTILIAIGIVAAWRRRRRFGIALVAGLLVATVPFLVDKIQANRAFSDAQQPWRDSVSKINGRALVFVDRSGPYLVHLNPFSTNAPNLDGRILWAVDLGPADLDLIAHQPNRAAYLQSSNVSVPDSTTAPPVPKVTVTRLHVLSGRIVVLRVRITNPRPAPIVVAYVRFGGQLLTRVLDTASTRGATYETTWSVALKGSVAPNVITLTESSGTIAVGASSGPSRERALQSSSAEQQFSWRALGANVEILVPGHGTRTSSAAGHGAFQQADVQGVIRVQIRGAERYRTRASTERRARRT